MLAKSKLNSIETLIPQALIDMEISHEEFITILKEKDKYEKNNFFFLRMHKMLQVSKEEYEKRNECEVEIIDKARYFWVNRKDLEVESDVANQAQIFDKWDSEKQKDRQELTPNAEYQRCRVFVRNDLVEKKIKSCRKSSKRFLEFKKKLGLDPNLVTCDEQDIISALQVAFEGEIVLTRYCIENKRIDAFFSKRKLGIEIDKYSQEGRNSNYEKNRQLIIENHGITFIRTNPDAADFNMQRLINQIRKHIAESIKNQTKKQAKKQTNVSTKKITN